MAHKISPMQLVFLLTGCRLSIIMLEAGSSGFWPTLGQLLGGIALTVLTALPLTIAGPTLWNHPWTGVAAGTVLLWTSALSLNGLGHFYRQGVYPRSESWVMVLFLAVACAYGASLGLEPLARFSLPAVVTGILFLGLLTVAGTKLLPTALPPMDWRFSTVLMDSVLFPELGLYLLCLPRVSCKANASRGTVSPQKTGLLVLLGWLVFSFLLGLWCAFLGSGELADGETALRPYRLLTLSSMAGFSPWGRHDLLCLAAFTFCGVLRTSVLLYGAAVGLGRLFPQVSLPVRGIAATGICLALSLTDFPNRMAFAAWQGIGLATLGILIGVLVLLWEKRRRPIWWNGSEKHG